MDVRITDNGDLRRLSKALRQYGDGKRLRSRSVKAIRAEVTPIAREVRAAYRAGPSKGGPKTPGRAQYGSLRNLLAKAVRVEVRLSGRQAGVRIRVDGRKMPPGMGSLPAAYEGSERWVHPAWGGQRVVQAPHPTFYRVVRRHSPDVRRRIDQVAGDVAREITKG